MNNVRSWQNWGGVKSADSLITHLSSMGIEVNKGTVQAVDVLAVLDKASFLFQLSTEAAQLRLSLRSDKLSDEQRAEIEGEIDCLDESIIAFSQQENIKYSAEQIEEQNASSVGKVLEVADLFRQRSAKAEASRLNGLSIPNMEAASIKLFQKNKSN
jgi:hypothetical protein